MKQYKTLPLTLWTYVNWIRITKLNVDTESQMQCRCDIKSFSDWIQINTHAVYNAAAASSTHMLILPRAYSSVNTGRLYRCNALTEGSAFSAQWSAVTKTHTLRYVMQSRQPSSLSSFVFAERTTYWYFTVWDWSVLRSSLVRCVLRFAHDLNAKTMNDYSGVSKHEWKA